MNSENVYIFIILFRIKINNKQANFSGDLSNRNANKADEKLNEINETHENDPSPIDDGDQISTMRFVAENSQLVTVKKTERNKIFGSLPNHLDSDEIFRENRKLIFFSDAP